jgi:hypothetical protein
MSDADDDSDSSDIGHMFEAASKRKTRHFAVPEKDDSDEDSDEESDDDAFYDKGGRKKPKQISVEARLSMMEQQKSIRERQRAAKAVDSDDSDEEEGLTGKVGGAAVRKVDKNAVKVQVEVRQMGEENTNQNVLSPDSDDSSLEDEAPATRSRRGPVSVDLLKQQGVSQETIDEICKSRQALEELKRAQQYNAHDARMDPAALDAAFMQQQLQQQQQQQSYGYGNGSGYGMPNAGAGMNGNMQLAAALLQQGAGYAATNGLAGNGGNAHLMAQALGGGYAGGNYSAAHLQQQQQWPNLGQFLKITVRARLERIGCEPTFQDTSVSVRENESLQVFMDRFLTTMNLTPANSVMTMQFNGHALTGQRTPASYGMTNGSTVDAMVLLTSLMDFQARSGNAVTAPVTANLGKSIELTLRQQSGKAVSQDVLSICMKEPFQALADKYRSSKSLGPSTLITFKFDGETMRLTRTPESYDMEDEDLVDVIVQ